MVDPISTLASIMSVIQISGTVLSVCYQYATAVKDAPRDIQWVINEVGSLKTVLEDLKTLVPNLGLDHSVLLKCLTAGHGPLATCELALRVISEEIGPSSRSRKANARLVWPLHAKAVQKTMEVIQKQKSNLILALAADEARAISSIEKAIDGNVKATAEALDLLRQTKEMTSDVRDTMHKIQEIKKEKQEERMVLWLRSTDPSTNHVAACKEHHNGTGSWLLESRKFRQWLVSTGQFIWLNGISGCGKTVLVSAVIQDVQKLCSNHPSWHCVYYYFDFNDAAKRQPVSMVRSILAQLECAKTPVPDNIRSLYERHGNGQQQPTAKTLMPFLTSTMNS